MRIARCLGLGSLIMGIVLWSGTTVMAQSAEQIAAAREILAKFAAADLPARSAQLVADAPVKERAPVAAAVGHAIARISPNLTPMIVSAICLKTPAAAPAVAAAAAVELPEIAGQIAVAASKAPGVKALEIRSAVIAAVPAKAVQVVSAMAAARRSASLGIRPGAEPAVTVSLISRDIGSTDVL
jgi:hypothetical protein